MLCSAKAETGLIALIEMAAAFPTGERVQTGALCRRHGVPERTLDQMRTALRKGGCLVSVRGSKRVYQLPPSREWITVAEVEDCLEGGVHAERQGDRDHAEFRDLEGLVQRARRARVAVLEGTTSAHLQLERDSLRQPAPRFRL
jgi:DNA-binding IscR family transcriptional regulator